MEEDWINNINTFIETFSKLTVRIITINSDGILSGFRSGFLYQPDMKYAPIVITAGHGVPPKGSFIETSILKDGRPLCINSGEFKIFYNYDDLDYAYSYLPIELIKNSVNNEFKIEYMAYRYKFQKAIKGEAYGFAVINNYELVESGTNLLLPRYRCYEVGMELIKQEYHINFFQTSGELKEDEYYEGASGSPIADPEGKITSILIGGTNPRKYLRAFRLDNIEIPTNKT